MGGHSSRALLVGRDHERGMIDATVSRVVSSGQPGFVLLEGEAGIGKTSLLDQLLDSATDRGATIRSATATPLGQVRPFGPLLDALGITGTDHEVRPDAVLEPIELVRASLARSPEERRSPLQSVPEQREVLVEGLVSVTESWLSSGPTVLAIDDLHDADPATLGALALLTRRLTDEPLLIAATVRYWPRPDELADLIGVWDESGCLRLRIGPLDEKGVRSLLEALAGAPPDDSLTELAETAGGNPFLLNEMMRSLQENGRLELAEGRAIAARTSDSDVLDRASATIVTRMARLGPEVTSLLQTAAVLGREFEVGELATVLGTPVASMLPTLQLPIDAGLLVDHGSQLQFQHELVRESVAATIPDNALPALQLDVATRLRASGAPVTRVVSYYLASATEGDADAIDVITEVALGVSGSAPAAAAEMFERALALAPVTHPGRDALVVDLVDALFWSGRFDDAVLQADTALARPLPTPLFAELHELMARSLVIQGRPADALEHLDQIQDLPGRSRWALALAGVFRVFSLDLDGAVMDATAALSPGSDRGEEDEWARALAEIVLSWVDNVRGYFDSAAERCARAVLVADGSPRYEMHRLLPYLFLGFAHINAGREQQGTIAIEQGRAIAEQLGTVWALPFYHYAQAQAHWAAGRLDDLLAECEAGLRCAADHNSWLASPYAYATSAAAHLYQGRLDDAGAQLDAGEALLGVSGPQYGLDWLMWIRGLWLEASGDLEGALLSLGATVDMARGMQAGAALTLIGPDLIRMRTMQGDEAGARQLLAELDAPDGGNRTAIDLLLQRCRGLLDGEPAMVEQARDGHRALGWAQEVLLDEEALVLALLRRGDREAADAQLRACLQLCLENGLTMVADRVRREAAAAGLSVRRGTSRRPTFGWDSLTETERRVAALVAEGRTNPQIADALSCSKRTVESHLNRIYRKVNVANRTELAVQHRTSG